MIENILLFTKAGRAYRDISDLVIFSWWIHRCLHQCSSLKCTVFIHAFLCMLDFTGTHPKDNRRPLKSDPQKTLNQWSGEKPLKPLRMQGWGRPENCKGDSAESGRHSRQWNLRVVGFPPEGTRPIGNEAVIRSITEESVSNLRPSPSLAHSPHRVGVSPEMVSHWLWNMFLRLC